jgi:hypothetical protein
LESFDAITQINVRKLLLFHPEIFTLRQQLARSKIEKQGWNAE